MLKNLADAPACLQRMLLCLKDYDIWNKYLPGRKMLIANALSHYAPLTTPVIPLDISVNHLQITPQKKINFQDAVHSDPTLHALTEMILSGWPEDICNVPMDLCPYHHALDVLTVEDGIILHGEALIIPPSERDKVLQSIHEGHQGISKSQYYAHQCIYWPGINQDIKCAVDACATCQCHCPQEPWQLLKPTPSPEHPWQHLGADFMHFNGNKYVIITDYYSKMPFIHKIPPSQCNTAKMISILKELFAEHGISELLYNNNSLQFASTLFAESATDWNFNHCTSALTNPHSNGQAEASMKIIKGLLTWSKYSGQDSYLAWLAYHRTHGCTYVFTWWDALPVGLVHNGATVYPSYQPTCYCWPWQSRPACLPKHSKPWPSRLPTEGPTVCQTDCICSQARCLWPPATIICAADHGLYIVQVIGSGQYQHAGDHICEHHPDTVKPDKHITTNVAPTTPIHPPATQAVQPAPCVVPTTPQPAAIPHTLWKTPTVHTPPHAQSVTLKLTGTAPAVPCHSVWSSKPPSQPIEEM